MRFLRRECDGQGLIVRVVEDVKMLILSEMYLGIEPVGKLYLATRRPASQPLTPKEGSAERIVPGIGLASRKEVGDKSQHIGTKLLPKEI